MNATSEEFRRSADKRCQDFAFALHPILKEPCMRCHAHPGQGAVSTCGCGKGLCPTCTNRFTNGRCEPCLLTGNADLKKHIIREWVRATLFGAGGIMMVLLISSGHNWPFFDRVCVALVYFVLFAAGSIGWRYLTAERGWTIVIFHPLFFFVAAFILGLKLFASVLVGLVVGPFRLWKGIKEVKFINTVRLQVARGDI